MNQCKKGYQGLEFRHVSFSDKKRQFCHHYQVWYKHWKIFEDCIKVSKINKILYIFSSFKKLVLLLIIKLAIFRVSVNLLIWISLVKFGFQCKYIFWGRTHFTLFDWILLLSSHKLFFDLNLEFFFWNMHIEPSHVFFKSNA